MSAHPGDIRTHPLEDCPVCQELGDWASCENSLEWIEAHEALRTLDDDINLMEEGS